MSFSCAFWGELADWQDKHLDCGVIVDKKNIGSTVIKMQNQKIPTVCMCECRTCKRAWEAAGRPTSANLKDK